MVLLLGRGCGTGFAGCWSWFCLTGPPGSPAPGMFHTDYRGLQQEVQKTIQGHIQIVEKRPQNLQKTIYRNSYRTNTEPKLQHLLVSYLHPGPTTGHTNTRTRPDPSCKKNSCRTSPPKKTPKTYHRTYRKTTQGRSYTNCQEATTDPMTKP